MGEINCRNCHCAKEEKENDELAIPENANATKVNKPHKEITTYFKTKTLELNSDNVSTTKAQHQRNCTSTRSEAKASIDINEDKLNKEIEEDFNNDDLNYSISEKDNKEDNDIMNKETNQPLSPISNNKYRNDLMLSDKAKMQFGIENKDELCQEEQQLYEEAQKNLNLFYAPEDNEENILYKKISKIKICSLIPSTKLKSTDANEIIYHGELKKLVNFEINAHKTQLYSSRFCTLNCDTFKYYKSKEQFLRNQRPLCSIPLNQITKINFAKLKKTSKKIDHIIICNRLGIKRSKENSPETNESLLIFTSEVEESIYRWYVILNYYLQRV